MTETNWKETLQIKNEMLNEREAEFDDAESFRDWAQSRARHAINRNIDHQEGEAMTNWETFRIRRDRKNRKRRERLLNKLQKAQAIEKREEIEKLSTWGRRFGRVCRLRAERH